MNKIWMKKLIVTDPVRIWSDLTSGTSDEKRECMGYDSKRLNSLDQSSTDWVPLYRWIKKFDYKMCCENWHVCLFVDNFSTHTISFKLTNIQLKFFKPNMTLFVQPCNAGIICCFKALYHHNFCACALNLNEAGECDIYKINLLEGMLMAHTT
jgi:hypothetical protein